MRIKHLNMINMNINMNMMKEAIDAILFPTRQRSRTETGKSL